MVDISGIDKASLLAALVSAAQPAGVGHLDPRETFTRDDAHAEIGRVGLCFDYVAGRPIKSDISGDACDPRLYDRDQGAGAFQRVVDGLRAESTGAPHPTPPATPAHPTPT